MSRAVGLRVSRLAAVYLATLAFLGIPVLVALTTDVPVGVFLRDPVTTLGGHALTGLQSHVGVLVWWSAASVCLFTAPLLATLGEPRLRAFVLGFGALSAVLALDDLFLVHEELVQRHLGVDEMVVVAAYGVAALWLAVAFRDIILRSDYWLLIAAALCFASSILIDQLIARYWTSSLRIVVEDGLKLLGIVSWTAYFVRICLRALSGRPLATRRTGAPEPRGARGDAGAMFNK